MVLWQQPLLVGGSLSRLLSLTTEGVGNEVTKREVEESKMCDYDSTETRLFNLLTARDGA